MADQEFAGGGRSNRGGKARGAGGVIARATVSTQDLRATPAGASAFSAAQVESILETAFDSLAAWNARDAGSHGEEKPVEGPGVFSACACAIAKPSATMSATPNAKFAHLRTMSLSYIRLRAPAIRGANEKTSIHETMQRHSQPDAIPGAALRWFRWWIRTAFWTVSPNA